eukprot:5487-Heterococcus_DN1.PRE.1
MGHARLLASYAVCQESSFNCKHTAYSNRAAVKICSAQGPQFQRASTTCLHTSSSTSACVMNAAVRCQNIATIMRSGLSRCVTRMHSTMQCTLSSRQVRQCHLRACDMTS